MSIITTLMEDGLMAAAKVIPSYYFIGAAALILGALFVWGKIWFHNKVEAEAQIVINKYIATQQKDETELKEISTGINTKYQILYENRIVVITKVVHDNSTIIEKIVPDKDTILSNGWIAAYNFSVQGLNIDQAAVSDKTPSGVSAVDALNVDNMNYGTCLIYKATAQGWQDWYAEQQEAIAKQNRKDK